MIAIQVLQGLMEGVTLFLIASGLTLIFGVSLVINFAHGSFYMLGAFLTYQLYPHILYRTVPGFYITIILCGLIVAVLGLLFEVLLMRRVYHTEHLMQLVVTIAGVLIIRDLVKVIWGVNEAASPVPDALAGAVVIGGNYIPSYQLAMVAVGIVVLILMYAALNYTRAGIILRAATDDRGMVALLGINQAYVFSGVFFVGSFLAGVAGGLAASFEAVDYLLDTRVIINAFIVVIIGGLGSLSGALIGAIAVGVLKALGLLWVPEISFVGAYLLVAVVLMVRSFRRSVE
ncbi:MAG: branched-chain amino acid ABC transporter permease [Candidatus Lambdaproteobacteria bacterium]|nr:branched-chain amino acid ABC transporter permease [Candidatus Lambdaproteobacteria bacterium]